MTQTSGSSAAPAATVTGYELPWVEKYRPMRLDDVVGNKDTIDRLKVIQKDGNCPHLLISGLPVSARPPRSSVSHELSLVMPTRKVSSN